MYSVTKHYPHSLGLSVVFRQFKATSHCAQFHGYALAFTAELTASTLDRRGWVYDFGGLKPIEVIERGESGRLWGFVYQRRVRPGEVARA